MSWIVLDNFHDHDSNAGNLPTLISVILVLYEKIIS